MKLSEVKKSLDHLERVDFMLEDGSFVPEHFHVTEIGILDKKFIDCGGTVRQEKVANFQLWDADDYEHRLKPQKLQNIIALSERILEMEDFEVEVEYQSDTIGKYDLGFDGSRFLLLAKRTACLAKDNCGSPEKKKFACPIKMYAARPMETAAKHRFWIKHRRSIVITSSVIVLQLIFGWDAKFCIINLIWLLF